LLSYDQPRRTGKRLKPYLLNAYTTRMIFAANPKSIP
jgi:hypothetical protein